MTHVYFIGQGAPELEDGAVDAVASSFVTFWSPRPTPLSFSSPDFLSFFSLGVAGDSLEPAALLKSKEVPGVLGVFVAEPNEANAPLPRPKADDAVEVGEAIPEVLNGDIALKGFGRPCEELSPKRFEPEKVRDEYELSPLPCSRSDTERDSLLLLMKCISAQ